MHYYALDLHSPWGDNFTCNVILCLILKLQFSLTVTVKIRVWV